MEIGYLECVSRSRELTPEESDELARLLKAERAREIARDWYRANRERHAKCSAKRWQNGGAQKKRERYATDPAFRARVLAENERSRLRGLGR